MILRTAPEHAPEDDFGDGADPPMSFHNVVGDVGTTMKLRFNFPIASYPPLPIPDYDEDEDWDW